MAQSRQASFVDSSDKNELEKKREEGEQSTSFFYYFA